MKFCDKPVTECNMGAPCGSCQHTIALFTTSFEKIDKVLTASMVKGLAAIGATREMAATFLETYHTQKVTGLQAAMAEVFATQPQPTQEQHSAAQVPQTEDAEMTQADIDQAMRPAVVERTRGIAQRARKKAREKKPLQVNGAAQASNGKAPESKTVIGQVVHGVKPVPPPGKEGEGT